MVSSDPQEETGKDFSDAHLADIWDLCLGNLQWGNSFPTEAGHCSAMGSLTVNNIILQIMPLLHN